MRGIVVFVKKDDKLKDKEGKPKVRIIIGCKCEVEKDVFETYYARLSEQFAHDYFTFCGLKSASELAGREVECTLYKENWTDKNGKEREDTYIKYINLIDADGNAIIMRKPQSDFDF